MMPCFHRRPFWVYSFATRVPKAGSCALNALTAHDVMAVVTAAEHMLLLGGGAQDTICEHGCPELEAALARPPLQASAQGFPTGLCDVATDVCLEDPKGSRLGGGTITVDLQLDPA